MNYLDFVLIIIIFLITIRGIFRGLITELAVLVALILGFFITITYLPFGVQVVAKYFPDIPEFVIRIVIFILLFLGVNIAVRLAGSTLTKIAKVTFLQPVNKVAGGIFAFLKITIIISIILMLFDFIPFSKTFLSYIGKDDSLLYDWIKNFAPNIYKIIAAILPGGEQLRERLMQSFNSADSTAREIIKTY